MTTKNRRQLCFGLLCLFSATSSAFDIVKDGEPRATVVVAEDASRLVTQAADDLIHHVRLMTDVALPLAKANEEIPEGNRIYVGASKLTEALGIDPSKLPREGFRILVKGNVLAIVGKDKPVISYHPNGLVRKVDDNPLQSFRMTQPATWFGVAHFLEKHCGVRWFWPGEEGVYYEETDDLSVGDMDEVNAPRVIMREIRSLWQGTWILRGFPKELLTEVNYNDPLMHKVDYGKPAPMVRDYRIWERRMRLGVGGVIKASHADGAIIREYYKTRPDFFAMNVDGKRPSPDEEPDPNLKLCVSKEELAQIQIERGRKLFQAKRSHSVEVITFDVGFQDSGGWCWCEECKALDPPEQSKRWYPVAYKKGKTVIQKKIRHAYLSDRYVTYWNRIAKGLEKEFPDKLIGGLIYGAVGPPPVKARAHPNIIVPYTGASSLRQYNPLSGVKRSLDGWFKAGLRNFYWRPNLMFFDYFGLPFYYAEDGGELVKYLVQNGAKGFDFDTWMNHFATDGVNIHVILRLMWNPDLDVKALIQEYCDKCYGRGGKHVHDYFMKCKAIRQEIMATKGLPSRNQDWVGTLGRFFDADARADLDRIAQKIQAAAKGDAEQFQRRVKVFLIGHQYTMLQAATMELTDKPDKTIEEYNRLIALVTEKEQFLEGLGATWAISAPSIRWATKKNKFGPMVGYAFYESFRNKRMISILPDRWKFFLDQPDAGEQKKLHTEAFDDTNLVTLSIHQFWEPQGFDYNGMAWYRTRFAAPKREPGKRYHLWFGAIDDGFWIYVNGEKVGEDFTTEERPEVWFTPYSCDVTDQLRFGEENLVAVKVRDIFGAGGIYKGAFLLEEDVK